MKKILSTLAVCIFLANNVVFAVEGYVYTAADVQKVPVYSQSFQRTNLPYGEYLKYYNIYSDKIDADFIVLSKDEEKKFVKTLSKSEKENYEYAKKVQKLVQKRNWNKVFNKYPEYFPAYLQYYNECNTQRNFAEALRILNKIKEVDKNFQIVNEKLTNYSFGILYFYTNQIDKALNCFKIYENTGDRFVISSMANCYYALKKYELAIKYAKKLGELQDDDKELLYSSYLALRNYSEANKYALQLLKENYCFDNLMKVQASSSYDSTKLDYAYKARQIAQNDEQVLVANSLIVALEQKKLENAVSKMSQFVKIPKWIDYAKQMPQNVLPNEVIAKQDEFFDTANKYLKRYQGQQLTYAFNSLAQEMNTYVQNKKNEFYQLQQLETQQALLREQRRSNALQRERNYIESEKVDYLYYVRPQYGSRYYPW